MRKNHSNLERFVEAVCIGVWKELGGSHTIGGVHL